MLGKRLVYMEETLAYEIQESRAWHGEFYFCKAQLNRWFKLFY